MGVWGLVWPRGLNPVAGGARDRLSLCSQDLALLHGAGPSLPRPCSSPRPRGYSPTSLALQTELGPWEWCHREGTEGSSLTIHVLNTLTGQPATGLATHLSQLQGPGLQWMELMKSSTNVDGHCPLFLAPGQVKAGTYKLHFDTGAYWQQLGYTSFYPYVEVVFTVTEQTRKLHIPLLISPFSYTTYKGS
uniref:hydroxyisourate hydrolase n=1 Tax=Chrysemys picta bellii TaxID=8478 RepID=A0A8C3HJP5_CHRPI